MKRPLVALALALIVGLTLRGENADLQVTTRSGVVEGKVEGGVHAYLGIPYAAPPVGDRRWKPPVPAAPWTGVRKATEFGSRPMQPPIYRDMVFRDPGCSEDCLSLNIWTPAKVADAKLPVMVWMFGGGFIAGGTSEQRQDGQHLAARGVVVVTVNYRLGVFGFLVHPDLVAESPHHAAGNYGLLDQLAAVQWVHDNIAAFGGDPANLTIFGESAGSMSVSSLMASPLAHGLFQKVIGESGSAFSRPWMSLSDHGAEDAKFLAERTGARTIAELRAIPAQQLLDAVSKGPGGHAFRPAIDGYFFPESPADLFAQHKQNDVPLLAGWNHDEGSAPRRDGMSPGEALKQTARDEFSAAAPEFLKVYAAANDAEAQRAAADFAGDKFIAFSTWRWLEAQVATGTAPAYRYRFDRAPPLDFFGRKRGVYHSADILYVFGSFDAQPQVPWTQTDRDVSNQIQMYWTNFARNGNPNGTGLPEWPRYSGAANWPVMFLDAPSAAKPDPFRARYMFLSREWKR